MEAESFFARWSQRNAEAAAKKHAPEGNSDAAPVQAREPVRSPPSLAEVARLTPDSDFTPFVARGVDEQVRRSAMKKLFADPRFNVMDGLDVYIEDYHAFTPIPAAMLAALNHAKALLDPLAQCEPPSKKPQDNAVQGEARAPSLAEDHDSATVPDDASQPDATPPTKEQNSHDDPLQDM